jgi:PAS domain S-box-containing protein
VNDRVFRGETVRWEVLSPKDNRWYHVVNTPIRHPDGSMSKMALIVDITERKQAEKALRQSEERYRLLFEEVPVGLYRTTPSGQILDANQAILEMLGYPDKETLMSVSMADIYLDPEDRKRWQDLMAREGVVRDFVTKFRRRDGKAIWVTNSSRAIVDQAGEVLYYEGSLKDITEQKQAEEGLRRTTRALRTLSACNRALLQATAEQAFLQEICQIIVKVGGYRLAWVGYALEDQAKTVHPVAQAGFEEGYLQTVNITWADAERGRGPTGTAIRTGKTCWVNNMLTDPDYRPWREEALRRGYASSLALPLMQAGQALGALNIYAAEPDAFDAQEVELLEELAGAVAYGIGVMRSRPQHELQKK